MNFPKFWAKGKCDTFSCWGWSNSSMAEAEALGSSNAEKAMARYRRKEFLKQRYGYGSDRPMRELVLHECRNPSGGLTAVITRNSYGCQVLNTAQVMFVDVDLPEAKASGGLGKLLKRFFGAAKPSPTFVEPNSAQADLLARAGKVVQRDRLWGWRVYRTRAGFRLLATHQLFDPAAILSDPVFDELGADPLYRQLCKVQKCFRARLTPKPWRCDAGMPPASWPWADARKERSYKAWEDNYSNISQNFATCDLVAAVGNQEVDSAIAPILAIHDEMTQVGSKLPLA